MGCISKIECWRKHIDINPFPCSGMVNTREVCPSILDTHCTVNTEI